MRIVWTNTEQKPNTHTVAFLHGPLCLCIVPGSIEAILAVTCVQSYKVCVCTLARGITTRDPRRDSQTEPRALQPPPHPAEEQRQNSAAKIYTNLWLCWQGVNKYRKMADKPGKNISYILYT